MEAAELGFKQSVRRAHCAVVVFGHGHFSDAPIGRFRVVALIAMDHFITVDPLTL